VSHAAEPQKNIRQGVALTTSKTALITGVIRNTFPHSPRAKLLKTQTLLPCFETSMNQINLAQPQKRIALIIPRFG
jgi:hypothetical protein